MKYSKNNNVLDLLKLYFTRPDLKRDKGKFYEIIKLLTEEDDDLVLWYLINQELTNNIKRRILYQLIKCDGGSPKCIQLLRMYIHNYIPDEKFYREYSDEIIYAMNDIKLLLYENKFIRERLKNYSKYGDSMWNEHFLKNTYHKVEKDGVTLYVTDKLEFLVDDNFKMMYKITKCNYGCYAVRELTEEDRILGIERGYF